MHDALQANAREVWPTQCRPGLSCLSHTAASATPAAPTRRATVSLQIYSIRDTIMHSRYLFLLLSALSQYVIAFSSMPDGLGPLSPRKWVRFPPKSCISYVL